MSSKRTSAPSYGFGSSTREHQEKVFVSQEHAALIAAPCSPGPVYDQRASIGPQVNGALESAPRYGFGTSNREHAAKVYISSEHEKVSGGRDAPGPGTYDAESGIGQQPDSKKATLPRYGFGSSTREHQQKVFVSAEHNKTSDYGKASPGQKYTLTPAVGTQVLSYGASPYAPGGARRIRNGSQPSWVMGKSQRFEREGGERAPGPGTYAVRAAVAPQVDSSKPSLPRFGFGTSNREHAAKVYISSCAHWRREGSRRPPACAPC